MKYIIADPDLQNAVHLERILECHEMLEFQGSFTSLEAAVEQIRGTSPDIAFIRMGTPELNAFRLVREIRERNRLSRVILMSSCREDAVEAYEYGADGFLMVPLGKSKIGQWLKQNMEKE